MVRREDDNPTPGRPDKAREASRRAKANMAFKSGMRGNEADPTRFLDSPEASQELPVLEKPVYNAGTRGTANVEHSLPGVQVGKPDEVEAAMGKTIAQRVAAGAKGNPVKDAAAAVDEEPDPAGKAVYRSGMRGAERPRRR